MYAKLKSNGQLQTAPNPLRIVISNPTDERYEYEGYHKVIETEPPKYDNETQYVVSHYEMDGNDILQKWEILDVEYENMEAITEVDV